MQRIGRKKWRIHAEPAEVVWLKIDLFWPKWEWAKFLLFFEKNFHPAIEIDLEDSSNLQMLFKKAFDSLLDHTFITVQKGTYYHKF
jgi:hypothetical protein